MTVLTDHRSLFADHPAAVLAGRQPDPAETSPYGCALVRFASLETVAPGEEAS
jgi:hypothetical protein